MTSIQPELWVDRGAAAVTFYEKAFGATVLHRVGEGEDIVAQLAVGTAAFWVAAAGSSTQRLTPRAIGGATGRTLLIVGDPDGLLRRLTRGRLRRRDRSSVWQHARGQSRVRYGATAAPPLLSLLAHQHDRALLSRSRQ